MPRPAPPDPRPSGRRRRSSQDASLETGAEGMRRNGAKRNVGRLPPAVLVDGTADVAGNNTDHATSHAVGSAVKGAKWSGAPRCWPARVGNRTATLGYYV